MGTLFSALYQDTYPFSNLFSKTKEVSFPYQLENGKRNALILWGGEDISPSIYGESPSRRTYAKDSLSLRDTQEIALAREAMRLGMLIIGICRGAQLMCALSGGKLIQHVNNHNRNHEVKLENGQRMITNSIHHQMMYLKNVEHKLIAYSKESDCYYGENENQYFDVEKEPEIAYIPKTNSLCIQGHPEFLQEEDNFSIYCRGLTNEYL